MWTEPQAACSIPAVLSIEVQKHKMLVFSLYHEAHNQGLTSLKRSEKKLPMKRTKKLFLAKVISSLKFKRILQLEKQCGY
jgi:hypothetical protein